MLRTIAAPAALILFACGGGSESQDAAPEAPDARIAADAALDAAAACSGPGDCECFSNYDCPESHACTSLDESGENVWCLEGERGTGEAGEPCDDESDCLSALCVEDAEGGFRCSDLCELPEECPDSLPRCLYIGFGVDESICAPPAPSR